MSDQQQPDSPGQPQAPTAAQPPARVNGRFAPGHSGNAKGRPKKGQTLTDLLRRELKKRDVEDDLVEGKMISRKTAVIRTAIRMAIAGDGPSIRWIFDRMDGPITEKLALEGTVKVKTYIGWTPDEWDPDGFEPEETSSEPQKVPRVGPALKDASEESTGE